MLTQDQKQFYETNGFLFLEGIFSENELDQCSSAYNSLFNAKKAAKSNLEAEWDGSWKKSEGEGENGSKKSVLSIHNLQCHASIFTKMLLNDNLLNAVSEIMGSPNILLHHTKAHIKPPQIGAPFPTHQDYPYFPFKEDSMMAVIIHLDDSEPENGGLALFPGSHKLGPLENKSDVPTHFYVDQEKFPLSKAKPVIAKRGQVLIFSYLLVHGSYPNISTRDRRILLFQMMSADDEPLKQVHLSPCHGMVLLGKNSRRNADLNRRHE